MLVGALRRGSGCRGGSRLLAQSLRRFVSSLPFLSYPPRIRPNSVQFESPHSAGTTVALLRDNSRCGRARARARAALINRPSPLLIAASASVPRW